MEHFITTEQAKKQLVKMTEADCDKDVQDSPWSVKAVKTFRAHDGEGFNATLYHRKTRVALVDDDGWGGGFRYEWLKEGYEEAFEAFTSTLGQPSDLGTADYYVWGPDSTMDSLVSEFLLTKQWKRRLKGKTIYALKNQKEGECFIYDTPFTEAMHKKIVKEHGDDIRIIYNFEYGVIT